MTIRARLTLLNVLVFTIVMTALGLSVRQHVKQSLEAGIDRSLEGRVRRLRGPRNHIDADFVAFARQRFQEQPNEPGPTPFSIYDKKGLSIISDLPALDPSAITRCLKSGQPVRSTVGYARCYTMLIPPDRIEDNLGPLAIQTTESLEQTNVAVVQFTRSLLTMLPLAMLLAAGGGLFLTSRALRPVRAVTEAAGRIGASDLSERLPVSGKDEFARLSETFNGMLARLEAAFDRQSRFVADASHELRTPLTVIKANTSLALADPALTPETRETFAEIDGAVDRTTRLVQDLLLLARSDASQLALRKEPLALGAFLSEVAEEARRLHPDAAPIALEGGASLTLEADPDALRRLLTNLLDNALRHTPSSGRVTLSARDETPFLTLSVADTGAGIAPEHLPHLGERFYRADASRARTGGGTGLGLAIARSIAEAHGGRLTIESEPGKGTTVRVVLPDAAA